MTDSLEGSASPRSFTNVDLEAFFGRSRYDIIVPLEGFPHDGQTESSHVQNIELSPEHHSAGIQKETNADQPDPLHQALSADGVEVPQEPIDYDKRCSICT